MMLYRIRSSLTLRASFHGYFCSTGSLVHKITWHKFRCRFILKISITLIWLRTAWETMNEIFFKTLSFVAGMLMVSSVHFGDWAEFDS